MWLSQEQKPPAGTTGSQQEDDLFIQKVSLSGRPTAPAGPGPRSWPEQGGFLGVMDGFSLLAHFGSC